MEWFLLHWDKILVAVVVIVVFLAFVREWASPDVVAMSALVFLAIFKILDAEDITRVFGNPAPLTVACMFILSAALERTGVIEALAEWFEKLAGGNEIRLLVAMILLVAPLSAFVNNTPVVVVFMPIILGIARKHDLMASRLLIPLSYAAIVGGTCTLIGTSTNLIAIGKAEAMAAEGYQWESMSMFEVAKLGLVFLAVTAVYLLTIGRKLVPDRVTLSTLFDSESGKEFLTQAYVSDDSPLVGKPFPETAIAKMKNSRIIEVTRAGNRLKDPLPEIVFEEGDQILLKSRVEDVMDIAETKGLKLLPDSELGLYGVQTETAVIMEGIVGPQSSLVGKSLREKAFRQNFGVLILAVHRRGVNLKKRFEDVKLAFGDTLLIEGPKEKMNELFSHRDLVNLSKPQHQPLRRNRAPIAVAALLIFMILGAFKVLPLVVLALLGVTITLIFKCLEPKEAYEAVDWRVIFMVFGMLGLGQGLQDTELANVIADGVVNFFSGNQLFGPDFGKILVLSMIYLMAAVLTELISNNAVAALLTPIAIVTATSLGADPKPFVIAVMFGSSASFSTPIGYQTNTYVYGAGGYKFTDFCKVGIPLAVILWLIASFLIPIIWPL